MAIENQMTPFKVASAVGGSVFLSSDKTHSLALNNARYLAQQLVMAAEITANLLYKSLKFFNKPYKTIA